MWGKRGAKEDILIFNLLHVGDTCTLFLMPASVNTFGYTPLYTLVFPECLISIEHEGIQPSLI